MVEAQAKQGDAIGNKLIPNDNQEQGKLQAEAQSLQLGNNQLATMAVSSKMESFPQGSSSSEALHFGPPSSHEGGCGGGGRRGGEGRGDEHGGGRGGEGRGGEGRGDEHGGRRGGEGRGGEHDGRRGAEGEGHKHGGRGGHGRSENLDTETNQIEDNSGAASQAIDSSTATPASAPGSKASDAAASAAVSAETVPPSDRAAVSQPGEQKTGITAMWYDDQGNTGYGDWDPAAGTIRKY